MSEPITHGPVSKIAGKLCKCSVCGQEGVCEIDFDDFYTRPRDGSDGPLYCLACLMSTDSDLRRMAYAKA